MTEITHAIELQELPKPAGSGAPVFQGNLGLIKNLEVELSVVVGRGRLTVERLFALREGDDVTLDTRVDDVIELQLDGRLVGRGELVAVGDHFGIRLTEICAGNG